MTKPKSKPKSTPRTFVVSLDALSVLKTTVDASATAGLVSHGLITVLVSRGIILACEEYMAKIAKLKS